MDARYLPWDAIFPFLNLFERICVARAYPPIVTRNLLLNKSLLNNELWARKQCEIHGVDYFNFSKTQLHNPGLKVTLIGGFALGLLRGRVFDDSDMDILYYRQQDGMCYPAESIVVDYEEYGKQQTMTFSTKDHWKGCVGEIAYDFGLIKTQGSCKKLGYPNTDHLSLLEPVSDLYSYLSDLADFDFTKVTYDGKHFRFKSIESIARTSCTMSAWSEFKRKHRIIDRIVGSRYDIFDGTVWEHIVNRMLDRTVRYRERGFRIHFREITFEQWVEKQQARGHRFQTLQGRPSYFMKDVQTRYHLIPLEKKIPKLPFIPFRNSSKVEQHPTRPRSWLKRIIRHYRDKTQVLRKSNFGSSHKEHLVQCILQFHLDITTQ